MNISVLITTIGRGSLNKLLDSIPKDINIYLTVDGSEHHDKVKELVKDYNINLILEDNNLGYWGHGLRNKYQTLLEGDYILHADDDDYYLEGAFNKIKENIIKYPNKMLIFRFRNKNQVYWKEPIIKLNNIGTPCGVIPNEPNKMGQWGLRYGGDFDFYNTCKFEYEFINEIVYETGLRE